MSFGADDRKFYDEFIKFKRYVEDTLENLDESNFSGNFKQMIAESSKGSAGFEAYADSEKAFARMFAKYETEFKQSLAEIRATADENSAEIALIASWKESNAEAVSSIASIGQMANKNGASITQLVSWKGTVDTSINDLQIRDNTLTESIASIRTLADTSGAFINLLAYSGYKNIDTSKGYSYDKDNEKYIFHDFDGNDIELSSYEFAGIYIEAMNNGVASKLTKIKLNADVIQFGEYASVDSIGNFYTKKLFGDASGEITVDGNTYPGFFYAEVDSGGFTEDKKLYGADFYIKSVVPFYGTSGTVIYGFHYGTTPGETSESINFVVGEQGTDEVKPVWGYNYGQQKFYPKGVWDFSACEVSGIPLYFS